MYLIAVVHVIQMESILELQIRLMLLIFNLHINLKMKHLTLSFLDHSKELKPFNYFIKQLQIHFQQ